MHSSMPVRTNLLTIAWLALLVLALVLLVTLAPIHLRDIATDWQLTAAAPALPDTVPYATFTGLMLALRYLALAVFLGTSGLIVLHQPRSRAGWLAAFALLFLPLAFNLGGYTDAWPYPPPWNQLLGILYGLAQLFGIAGLVLLIYVFPDGSFHPRWSAWFAGGLLVLLTGFLIASRFIPDASGLGWAGSMILLLLLLLGGLAGQMARYRQARASGRRSSRGFVIALILLLVGMAASILLSGENQAIPTLVFLFVDLLLFCLLPLYLAYAIFRYGLWASQPAPSRRAVSCYLAGWAALLAVGITALFLAGRQSSSAAAQPAGELAWNKPPIPLIVDTDLSMDDHLALLFLLRHPGVEVKAITVSGTGEVHCQPGVRNMLDILEMLSAPEIPVTCGREVPLGGEHAFPDSWREGADTLYGVVLPRGTRQPYPGSAVELIQSMLVEEEQPVTLLTLGPLTNPGEALAAHPDLAAEIERIVIMGGAVGVPGNVGPSTPEIDNQVAEWNIYADPLSANLVLRSGAPVTLVPLDATNFVPVSAAFFTRLEGSRAAPAAQLAYDLMSARREVVLSGTAFFWDILTAAIVLDGSLASYKIGGMVVDESEGLSSGQTRLDENGPRASYAVWADRVRFENQFLQALNH